MGLGIATFTRWSARRLPPLPRGLLPAGRLAYVDIETTGLCPDAAHVTLVGIAYRERNGRRLSQFFASSPEAEPAVLRATRDLLRSFAATITYNGVGFDLPFLRRRARRLGLRWPWIETYDLLWTTRAWRKHHAELANCRLQTVMTHFSLGRRDHTTGYEMVDAYRRWLKTRDPAARRVIVQHNADDVLLLPEVAHLLLRDQRRIDRHV